MHDVIQIIIYQVADIEITRVYVQISTGLDRIGSNANCARVVYKYLDSTLDRAPDGLDEPPEAFADRGAYV